MYDVAHRVIAVKVFSRAEINVDRLASDAVAWPSRFGMYGALVALAAEAIRSCYLLTCCTTLVHNGRRSREQDQISAAVIRVPVQCKWVAADVPCQSAVHRIASVLR